MEPVTVVVPVLRRPQNAEPFMASLRESVEPDAVPPVIAVANVDDEGTTWAWRRAGATILPSRVPPGSYGQKANLAARFLGTLEHLSEWMFLVGDDVCFHPGWLEAALTDLPDTACVVGVAEITPEQRMDRTRISPAYEATLRSAEHTNHMLIRMDYVREKGLSWDGPGTVCGPYRHWYTNNEMSMKAQLDGVWVARPGSVVEHLHPYFDSGVMDDVYRIGEMHAEADRRLFEDRLRRFAPEEWRRRQPAVVDLT